MFMPIWAIQNPSRPLTCPQTTPTPNSSEGLLGHIFPSKANEKAGGGWMLFTVLSGYTTKGTSKQVPAAAVA